MLLNPDSRELSCARFLQSLEQATSQIEAHYIRLPVSYSEKDIYRERVYCYELYHQLRCCIGNDFNYVLNGEVDKSGHKEMQGEELTDAIPDLLVHQPGCMEGNLIVVEVKAISADRDGIERDLAKMAAFLTTGCYYRGIYLIYGDRRNSQNKISRIGSRIRETGYAGRIALYWHRKEPESAQRVPLSNPSLFDAING